MTILKHLHIHPPGVNCYHEPGVRHHNFYEITLVIENFGAYQMDDIRIVTDHIGFQCINNVDVQMDIYQITLDYTTDIHYYSNPRFPNYEVCRLFCNITNLYWDTYTITYTVTPILFHDRHEPYQYWRLFDTRIEFMYGGTKYSEEGLLLEEGLPGDIDDALNSADYLIVTNPYNLF